MSRTHHPARKSAPVSAEQLIYHKRPAKRICLARALPEDFASVQGTAESGYWLNGVKLKHRWGVNVWAAETCDEQNFDYTEQVLDATGMFAPIPAGGSVKVKLGVGQERQMGLGACALERIFVGDPVCYMAGAVSIGSRKSL